MKNRVWLFTLIITLLCLAACQPAAAGSPTPTVEPANMPNPASKFCEDQGGELEIRSSETGQQGFCKFDDGSECDEWAYYRGECAPGDSLNKPANQETGRADVGLANPAAVYCQEQGYRLESRTGEDGEAGICIFNDGSECDEWAYWRGECGPASNDAQVNLALEVNLPQATQLEILKLDPLAESSQPYRLLLTIDDEFQLADVMRTLNTLVPRTPATLCISDYQLRFHSADGTVQEFGYMCDETQPTLSGEQDFWNGQEAQAPAQFVALIDSHLGGVEEDSVAILPESNSLNLLEYASLTDVQRIEVMEQIMSESEGIGQASIQLLAVIKDPAGIAEILASLEGELALTPRARCVAAGVLVFYRADNTTFTLGLGCNVGDGSFLRLDDESLDGDIIVPPLFLELILAEIRVPPLDS
ncbi:MAG: DUF333 domain-containing protein [Anaerolineales bacterium]|nr:DUF333 domain-containing protein [Anaerolineales bacterium]